MVRRRWWEEPEQIKRWKIFRGDRVEVLRGPGRGERGVVLRRLMAENKLVVQGINVQREFDFDEQTGEKKVVKREAPIWYHDVNVVDPQADELGRRRPTKTKWGFLASGERVRVAKRSGALVPRVKHTAKYTHEERMERPQYQGNTPREAVTAASYMPPELLQERRAARARPPPPPPPPPMPMPPELAEWGCDAALWEAIRQKEPLIKLVQKGDEEYGRKRIARMRELVAAGDA